MPVQPIDVGAGAWAVPVSCFCIKVRSTSSQEHPPGPSDDEDRKLDVIDIHEEPGLQVTRRGRDVEQGRIDPRYQGTGAEIFVGPHGRSRRLMETIG